MSAVPYTSGFLFRFAVFLLCLFTIVHSSHHFLNFCLGSQAAITLLPPSPLLAVDIPSLIPPISHTPPVYNIEYQEEHRKYAEECHISASVVLSSIDESFS